MPLVEIDSLLALDNPRDAKMKTALEITKIFHGEEKSQAASDAFVQKFQKREIPNELEIIKVTSPSPTLLEIVKQCSLETSNSELKRLIMQGGVKIDNIAKNTPEETITISAEGLVIKVGKKSWFKIVN